MSIYYNKRRNLHTNVCRQTYVHSHKHIVWSVLSIIIQIAITLYTPRRSLSDVSTNELCLTIYIYILLYARSLQTFVLIRLWGATVTEFGSYQISYMYSSHILIIYPSKAHHNNFQCSASLIGNHSGPDQLCSSIWRRQSQTI